MKRFTVEVLIDCTDRKGAMEQAIKHLKSVVAGLEEAVTENQFLYSGTIEATNTNKVVCEYSFKYF